MVVEYFLQTCNYPCCALEKSPGKIFSGCQALLEYVWWWLCKLLETWMKGAVGEPAGEDGEWRKWRSCEERRGILFLIAFCSPIGMDVAGSGSLEKGQIAMIKAGQSMHRWDRIGTSVWEFWFPVAVSSNCIFAFENNTRRYRFQFVPQSVGLQQRRCSWKLNRPWRLSQVPVHFEALLSLFDPVCPLRSERRGGNTVKNSSVQMLELAVLFSRVKQGCLMLWPSTCWDNC